MSFVEFFNTVKNAEFSFYGIRDWIVSIYESIVENPDIVNIWNVILDKFNTYLVPISIILVAFGLTICFYGQKITGIVKFILFFIIGFAIGVHFLFPIVPDTVGLKSWVIGLVVAIVAAVLYKYLYYALIAVAVGYSVYRICFTGFFIKATAEYTAGKGFISLLVAIGCVALVLAFNKWTERILTAFLGGYISTLALNRGILHFTSLPIFEGSEWVGILILTVALGVVGFAFQVKHRELY